MLTVKQLLVASGQSSREVMHVNGLRQQIAGPRGPFSLAKVIAAYANQRRVYFVSMTSANILLSDDVQTFNDLVSLSPDFHGELTKSEVETFAANLENFGVLLRFVDKNLRQAAIIGTVASINSVPTVTVDAQNFITVKDWFAGASKVGTGLGAVGTVLITIALAPTLAAGGEAILVVGAVGVAIGAGIVVGAGIAEMLQDDPPTPQKPSSDNTSNDVDSPDGPLVPGDQDTIEIPNAVAVGDPPNGVQVDDLLTDVGDFALDLALANIPIGWDPDAGVGLPGLGSGDLNPGDGDGNGEFGEFPG
jgi:predicted phage tail protein